MVTVSMELWQAGTTPSGHLAVASFHVSPARQPPNSHSTTIHHPLNRPLVRQYASIVPYCIPLHHTMPHSTTPPYDIPNYIAGCQNKEQMNERFETTTNMSTAATILQQQQQQYYNNNNNNNNNTTTTTATTILQQQRTQSTYRRQPSCREEGCL